MRAAALLERQPLEVLARIRDSVRQAIPVYAVNGGYRVAIPAVLIGLRVLLVGREQAGQGGEQGSVGPADPRSRAAPLQHCELVVQDEDLNLLGGLGSGAQHHPAQELGARGRSAVAPPADHAGRWLVAKQQVKGNVHSFGHPQGQHRPAVLQRDRRGVRCAVDYNCVHWGAHELSPQAGIGVFERGPDGLLTAVRVYDGIEAPASMS